MDLRDLHVHDRHLVSVALCEPDAEGRTRPLQQFRHQGRCDRLDVMGHRRNDGRPLHCPATILSQSLLFPRPSLDQFRAHAAASYLCGYFRLWRQCPDRHVFLCGAADLPGQAMGRLAALVRVLGLQHFHRAGRHRLSPGHHPGARICRAGMVCRSVAHHRLGLLSPHIHGNAVETQGTPYLRRQLVLPFLHRHDCHPARRQQSGDAGLAAGIQELFALLRSAGCAHTMVVRP